MEVLEKLQAVHETMGLLQSHSLVSPHSSSNNNRFLADFVIFLEGVCKESEEMVTRCKILMDVIPKMMGTGLFQQLESRKLTGKCLSSTKPQVFVVLRFLMASSVS
jgi:hypothetical protein